VGPEERASQSLFRTSEKRMLYLEGRCSLSFLFRRYLGGTETEHHIVQYTSRIITGILRAVYRNVNLLFLPTQEFYCALFPIKLIITVHYYFILLGVGR